MFPLSLAGTKLRPFPMEKVEYTLNTSTGNQDITLDASIGKGKTPIAAMFVHSQNVLGSDESVSRLSIGLFDGTDEAMTAIYSQNGATTTNTATWGATDMLLAVIDNTQTFTEASGVSLIENGVRINITKNLGVAYRGTCYLFFDDDGAAKVDTFTSHATEDSSVTVTPGIATDALVTLNPDRTGNWFDDAAHNNAIGSLGFVVNGDNQNSVRWVDQDGQATTAVVEAVNTVLGASTFTAVGDTPGLEFNNFTATGFDAVTRNGSGDGTHGYLALEMPNAQFWTGVIDTPTSVSEASYTSPAFPVLSLIAIPTIAEDASGEFNATDRTAECFGVAAATKRGASSVTVASEDGIELDPAVTDTESHYNASTIRAAGADDHNESEANSFTTIPTGFKLNFTTAHSTAQKWPVLAIGRK